MEMYLICQDEVHNKFWHVQTNGKTLTRSWGRIGTIGQSTTDKFYSDWDCEYEAQKLINSKTKKGYVEAITPELIMNAYIQILSDIAKRHPNNPSEVYFCDDKFNKCATIEFVDGASDHIIFRHYYENGNKKSEHEWVNNKQHGRDLGWYEDGSKHWEREYKEGKLINEKRW